MTWLAFPLTAFISLQPVGATAAPSALEQQDAAIVVAQRSPGAPVMKAGDQEGRRTADTGVAPPIRRDSAAR